MSPLARRTSGFLHFARREIARSWATPLDCVEALWRCKPAQGLRVLHPEVKRTRSYIPETVYRRRMATHSRGTLQFFGSKLGQKFWLDRNFPDHAPPVLYYVCMSELVPVVGSAIARPIADLPDLVRQYDGLFLKPIDGTGGRGAVHLASSGDAIAMNATPIADEALVRLADEQWQGHLVSEVIRNSEWVGSFYNRTLNTMRILTGVYRDTRTPVVLAATLKIGRDSTYPTDNWRHGRGGLTAKVDLEDGRLGSGLVDVPGRGGGRRESGAHPDTHVTIEGEIVPDWPAIKQLMRDIAGRLPFFGLIGWDVALTPSGVVIVEGNSRPGLEPHEAHESLLATADQRRFFAGMNIQPRRAPWWRIAGMGRRGQVRHKTA